MSARVVVGLVDEVGKLLIQILGQVLAQVVDVHGAGAHDRPGVGILRQRHEQMLKRGKLVPPLVGKRQRAVQ